MYINFFIKTLIEKLKEKKLYGKTYVCAILFMKTFKYNKYEIFWNLIFGNYIIENNDN